MAETAHLPPISVQDYLADELTSEVRHEYVNGEVFAMVGTSAAHNLIALNLATALHTHLRNGPCHAFMSDFKVHIQADRDERFYYPDLAVSCAEVQPGDYYTESPVLVVEVLSSSTERHDRSDKAYAYRKLPSLQEYLLVAQDLPRVEVYRRASGWDLEIYGAGDRLHLSSVDLELAVAEVYLRTGLAEGG